MPKLLLAALFIAALVVPILLMVRFLVGREKRLAKVHLEYVAQSLGLEHGAAIANRVFEFPSCLGSIDDPPVWLGTTSGKRKSGNHYILFQVVVGRHPGVATSTVGPHHMDLPTQEISFADIKAQLEAAGLSDALSGAKLGPLDGTSGVDTGADTLIRTFTIASLTSKGWAEKAIASARMMVALAKCSS